MNAQAYDQYKKTSIESVGPGKLLLMLFEGAIRNIDSAKKAILDKDINLAHNQIIKTQNIILELISSLNMEYEISNQLFYLYEFMFYQLTLANAGKDIKILDEVRALLSEFHGVWDEAGKKAGVIKTQAQTQTQTQIANNAAPSQGLNIQG